MAALLPGPGPGGGGSSLQQAGLVLPRRGALLLHCQMRADQYLQLCIEPVWRPGQPPAAATIKPDTHTHTNTSILTDSQQIKLQKIDKESSLHSP